MNKELIRDELLRMSNQQLQQLANAPVTNPSEQLVQRAAQELIEIRKRAAIDWKDFLMDDETVAAIRFIDKAKEKQP